MKLQKLFRVLVLGGVALSLGCGASNEDGSTTGTQSPTVGSPSQGTPVDGGALPPGHGTGTGGW